MLFNDFGFLTKDRLAIHTFRHLDRDIYAPRLTTVGVY
jgi:hypothetical protein